MTSSLTPTQEAYAVLLSDPTSDLGKAFAAVLSRDQFLGAFTAQLQDTSSTIRTTIQGFVGTTTDASTTAKGVVQLTGDLAGTATAPTVKSAGGLSFQAVSSEPTIYNPSTTGGDAAGAPIRIGNVQGQMRIIPYNDGMTYIQTTSTNGLSFSGLNAAQGATLSFNFAATALSGTLSVSGTVTASTAPTAAGHLVNKTYADALTKTASQISDSTSVGRSVLTASDAAAARTAIGAGTLSATGGITAIQQITQAAYTALGTKVSTTLYVIVG